MTDIGRPKHRPASCSAVRKPAVDLSKDFPSMFRKHSKRFERRPGEREFVHSQSETLTSLNVVLLLYTVEEMAPDFVNIQGTCKSDTAVFFAGCMIDGLISPPPRVS